MGIINDFKRLFWVNKAVAKSAADKTVEKGREIENDFSEKASDAWEKGKKVAEDVGEKVTTKAKDYIFITHSSGMSNIKVNELSAEC